MSGTALTGSLRRGARVFGLLTALCACSADDQAARPSQAAPDAALALAPPPRLTLPKPSPAPRDLCSVLSAILATDAEAYAAQRSSPIAADQWLGRAIVPGTERCTIEGAAWPRARYACVSHPFQADNRDGAEAKFSAMTDQIDQCLNRPIWFPRAWQRGEPFQFAMGERLQAWTDQSTTPPSQVVLKLQQDLDRSGYALQLSLETVR